MDLTLLPIITFSKDSMPLNHFCISEQLKVIVDILLLPPKGKELSYISISVPMNKDVKDLQLAKASLYMRVTLFSDGMLFPMLTDVKPSQRQKAPKPMDVTLFGMLTDVKPLQPLKAALPIDVTL